MTYKHTQALNEALRRTNEKLRALQQALDNRDRLQWQAARDAERVPLTALSPAEQKARIEREAETRLVLPPDLLRQARNPYRQPGEHEDAYQRRMACCKQLVDAEYALRRVGQFPLYRAQALETLHRAQESLMDQAARGYVPSYYSYDPNAKPWRP